MKNITKFLSLVVLLPLLSSCGYNTMVSQQEGVDQAWANVESAYQRRADLIDNLVNTVKGVADFEKETYIGVAEARTGVKKAQENLVKPSLEMLNDKTKLSEFYASQETLASQGKALFNIAIERYPDLKANQNFLELQAQLEGTENRINVERNKFNTAAKEYNTSIRQFPRVIYAGWFGFEKKPYFEAAPGSDKAPEVQF